MRSTHIGTSSTWPRALAVTTSPGALYGHPHRWHLCLNTSFQKSIALTLCLWIFQWKSLNCSKELCLISQMRSPDQITPQLQNTVLFFFSFWRFYLFPDRGEGKEKERERNISVWWPLVHPHLGPGLQPRHVPWLGTKPVTIWLAGWHSVHWATSARALCLFLTWVICLLKL